MIITVGFACYDQFFFTNEYPLENSKNVATGFFESGGGPAANAAYLLGLWGEDITHICHLGLDTYADKIIAEFKQVDVKTNKIIRTADMLTPLANINVSTSNGARTVVVRKMHNPPALTKHYDFHNPICTAILIDGHERDLSIEVIKQNPHAKVVMDAGSVRESTIELAQYTDFMVVSEAFACGLSKQACLKTKEELIQALTAIKKITKGEVVITLGRRGAVYLDNNQFKHCPSYICHAVDTTGAGDIFHGAFTYGVSYGWGMKKIIEFSSLAAAISIERKGVRPSMPTLVDMSQARFSKNISLSF